jgi:hypothetical protein
VLNATSDVKLVLGISQWLRRVLIAAQDEQVLDRTDRADVIGRVPDAELCGCVQPRGRFGLGRRPKLPHVRQVDAFDVLPNIELCCLEVGVVAFEAAAS